MTNKSSGKQRIAQTEGYKEQGMNVKQQDTHTFPKVEYDLMTQFWPGHKGDKLTAAEP